MEALSTKAGDLLCTMLLRKGSQELFRYCNDDDDDDADDDDDDADDDNFTDNYEDKHDAAENHLYDYEGDINNELACTDPFGEWGNLH